MTLPYVWLLAGAALMLLAIAWSAWRQRGLPSTAALIWLSLAVAEWIVAYALELVSPHFGAKLMWAKLQYVGSVLVPVAWLVLAVRLADEWAPAAVVRGERLAAIPFLKHSHIAAFMLPRSERLGDSYLPVARPSLAGLVWCGRYLALLSIPLLTLVLALTNDLHHMLWSSAVQLDGTSMSALSFSYGAWFWVHTVFSYLLLLLGSLQLAQIMRGSPAFKHRQMLLLLLSACLPWAGNLLYLARIAPLYPLDPTPLAFAISLLLGWVLLRVRLLQGAPFTQGAIIDHLQDGVLVFDPWQRVVAINSAAEQITGIHAGAALGQPIGRVLADHPALLELSSAADDRRIEIAIGQPGDRRHYDAQSMPLPGLHGQIAGQMLMLHDITQRKRSEDAHRFLANASTLLASSLDYETTLATVARLVVPFLADWCVVYIHGADQTTYCTIIVAADPAKQALADDLRLGDRQLPASYLRLPRTGQSQLIVDVSDADLADLAADTRQLALLSALGLRSMISVPLIVRSGILGTLVLAAGDSGRSYGVRDLALAEDLAGRMALAVDNARLFEELHLADRAKSELLAHMNHEIRTPISGVLGMTDLLLETDLAAEQRDFVETIHTGGKALLAVVNGVLDFSKIEAGKLELEQAPFDVQACVEEAIDMVAVMAADKQLDLACVFDPAMPARLIGDLTRLRQVLLNLLSNAIKFTHMGDVFVSVAAQALDQGQYQLRFSVADTGVGIPSDRLQDIFTPFSQLGAATYRRYGGTGLGLAISRRLVALMGGQIWVESQVDVGSTFSFTITVAADPDTPVVVQPAHPSLAGKRLLIVDERRRSQQALVAYAESVSMLPCATASALEALTWVRQGQPFDVAIIDVLNSEMHGLTLASEIRRYRDAHALPILFVDMLGRHALPRWQAEDDYQVLLHKPLRLLQLQAALINVFDGRVFHANPPAKRSTTAAWPGDDQALRILLAEDDPVNQRVIVHMVQKMGYQIEVVRDGDLALAAIEQGHYDVALLDVQMPSKDGLEVAQVVRQRFPPERQPYLVAITANVIEGAREECLSAGMDDYISKPIQVAELMQVIEMHRLRARSTALPHPQAAFPNEQHTASERAPDTQQVISESMTWQVADLIAHFLDDASGLLTIMQAAAESGDLIAIQRAAHRLKSSSALLTAPLLSNLCDQLEQALRMNAAIDVREQVECIRTEFERVKTLLST